MDGRVQRAYARDGASPTPERWPEVDCGLMPALAKYPHAPLPQLITRHARLDHQRAVVIAHTCSVMWAQLLHDVSMQAAVAVMGADQMETHPPTSGEKTVVTLVRDADRFEAIVAPATRSAAGTHELRYLWNRRPFISRVFQRGAFDALLASVMALRDELVTRGWHLAEPQGG